MEYKLWIVAAVALLLSFLGRVPAASSSSWSQVQHDLRRTGFSPAVLNLPKGLPTPNWTGSYFGPTEPFLVDGVIYVTYPPALVGYKSDGTLAFVSSSSLSCVPGDPAFADNGEIFLVCSKMLIRLSKTGAVLDYWDGSFSAASPILSPDQNSLTFLADLTLYSFSTRPLQPRWNVTFSSNSAPYGRITVAPDGSLFLSGSTVYKYSPEGLLMWNSTVWTAQYYTLTLLVTLDTASLCNRGRAALFVTTPSQLIALDAATGKKIKQYDFGSYHGRPPSYMQTYATLSRGQAADSIILARVDGFIECIDALTLTLLWFYDPLLATPNWHQAMVDAGGHIFVTTSDSSLYQFDLSSGEKIWQARVVIPDSGDQVGTAKCSIADDGTFLYCASFTDSWPNKNGVYAFAAVKP